jgi:hypothetical protein
MKPSFVQISNDATKQVYLNGYHWDERGLIVEFLDDNPEKATDAISIQFPPDVLSVRITHMDQSWKIEGEIYQIILQTGQAESSFHSGSLIKLHTSPFIQWYEQQEALDNPMRNANIVHYLIFIDDTLIEIIDDREPIIKTEPLASEGAP